MTFFWSCRPKPHDK